MATIRAAVAQLAPVLLDGPASVDKTCRFIAQAGLEKYADPHCALRAARISY